jgi:heme-degrading monooxygenase HmoA
MQTSTAEVIRLFRFRPVRTAFDSILRDDMIPALLEMDGIVDVYVGRQGPDELGPRVIATIWTSREAMAAGVGESFDRPIFRPEYLQETIDRSWNSCR